MSEPQKTPEPSPKNKQLDPISRFKEEYGIALVDAETSVEHTATAGWQNLYAGQRRLQRENRRKLSDSLRNVADRLEVTPLDENGIKEIGELKKQCQDLNDDASAFDLQTVAPVREPSERCQRIIEEAISLARMEEERHPLVNTGLEELMKIAVREAPKARWEDDAGKLIVIYK